MGCDPNVSGGMNGRGRIGQCTTFGTIESLYKDGYDKGIVSIVKAREGRWKVRSI